MLKPTTLAYHFILLLLCCNALDSLAQDIYLTGGANLSSAIVKLDRQNLSEDFRVKPQWGLVAGASLSLPLREYTEFTASILFTTKGFEISDTRSFNNQIITGIADLRFHYLDIPLTVDRYLPAIHSGFFVRIGAFVGIGVGGIGNAEISVGNQVINDSQPVTWGKNEGEFPRLDYGGIGGVGFKSNRFRYALSYQLGFQDLFKNQNEDQAFRNSVLMLTCAYKIVTLTKK